MKDVFFAGDDEDSPQQWSRGRIYFGILDDEEDVDDPPVVGFCRGDEDDGPLQCRQGGG